METHTPIELNKYERIETYHRVGRYFVSNACWPHVVPCYHFVLDTETGILKATSGMDIYNYVKSNPELSHINGYKYSHFDYCGLINPEGYSSKKELLNDIHSKETQDVRDERSNEWADICNLTNPHLQKAMDQQREMLILSLQKSKNCNPTIDEYVHSKSD